MDSKQDTQIRPGKVPTSEQVRRDEERRRREAEEEQQGRKRKPATPAGVRTK